MTVFLDTTRTPEGSARRGFQLRFWKEAREAWGKGSSRLLMVACTGSGKSLLIALAPFANGARNRVLITVPWHTILEQMRKTLGGDPAPGTVPASDEKPPVLRERSCLDDQQSMPKVLVLNDLPKKTRAGLFV